MTSSGVGLYHECPTLWVGHSMIEFRPCFVDVHVELSSSVERWALSTFFLIGKGDGII